MRLNNIWGYGQLFGYSGLDGENRYYNDFVGTLTNSFQLKRHRITIIFFIYIDFCHLQSTLPSFSHLTLLFH